MARYHALYLSRLGFDVYLHNREKSFSDHLIPRQQKEKLQRLLAKSASPDADRLYYHAPDGVGKSLEMSLTCFETATIHPRWVEHVNRARHVFLVSEQNRNLLIEHGADAAKLTTVNLGYDPDLYYPNAEPKWPKQGKFVFLFVGHFNPRKGIETLIQSFCDTFQHHEPVMLRIVTQPMFDKVDVEQTVQQFIGDRGLCPEIDMHVSSFNGGFREEEMASVYASGDCFVSPTKGEAFNLPCLEAFACGLQVIATRCGGQLDFLNDRNAHLIEVASIKEDAACTEFNPAYRGLKFWNPDPESLSRQMRSVYEGCRKEADSLTSWTWDIRTQPLAAALRRIL